MRNSQFQQLLEKESAAAVRVLAWMAWEDGVLEPEEHSRLRDAVARLPEGLQEGASLWLDPSAPPDVSAMHALRARIAEDAALGLTVAVDSVDELAMTYMGADTERLRDAIVGVRETGTHIPWKVSQEDAALSAAIREVLEAEWAPQWETIRGKLRTEKFRPQTDLSKEAQREQTLSWLQDIASTGIARFPEVRDGHVSMSHVGAAMQTFSALSTFDLSLAVKFGVQFGLFGGSIYFLGNPEQHARYLDGIGRGEILGGFAMTESGHGSNVQGLETTATWDFAKRCFILHTPTRSAYKEWIGNAAAHAEYMTVFAQLIIGEERYGVHAFVVPIRDGAAGNPLPGITIEDCGHKMGLNGVDNGRLAFDNVEVARTALLNRYGDVDEEGNYTSPIPSENARFFTMLGTLVGGRITVGHGAVSAARTALMIAVRYGEARRQFGPTPEVETPIMNYPAHRERLLPHVAKGFMYQVAMNDVARRLAASDETNRREVESLAAGMKAVCTWYAIDACQNARECCGGQGYATENRIAQLRKDVDVFATFEGDNVVLLNLLGRNLLTGYARSFQHSVALTIVRQLGRLAAQKISARNPFLTRQTDEAHLRDPQYHLDAFTLREQSLLSSAARRIKKRTDAGMNPFDAVMDIQDHVIALGLASMDAYVARVTNEWVASLPEGPVRERMELCRQMTAIDALHRDSAWFLENGYMEGPKARELRRLRMQLIEELREHAIPLVNALGHVEEALASPIGAVATPTQPG